MGKLTLSLFYEALASLRLTTRHSDALVEMPPMYQTLVPPSPISISAAVFKVFYLRDFPRPRMPLIFISLEQRMVSCDATG